MIQSERLVALSNGLQVLSLFDQTRPFLTIQSVAETVGLTRAAARRILLTLVEDGYLIQYDRNFVPSANVLQLGFNYFTALGLPGLAQPGLDRLSARVGESVGLNMLEHGVVILVARAEPSRLIRLDTRVGMATPAYASASGRILLAGLRDAELQQYLRKVKLERWGSRTVATIQQLEQSIDRARKQDWYFAYDEARDGLSAFAVPVRMPDGEVVAAINLFFLMLDHVEADIVEKFLPILQKEAEEIEKLLSMAAPVLHALTVRLPKVV